MVSIPATVFDSLPENQITRNGGNEASPNSFSCPFFPYDAAGKDGDTFAGTFSSVPLPEIFPSVSYQSSHPSEDGQYDDSGIHESSGIVLLSITHVGTQTYPLGLRLFLPMRAKHAPGNLNRGVELLSGVRRVHPVVVEQIWAH